MWRIVTLFVLVVSVPALAQTAQTSPLSVVNQALSEKLFEEINAGIQLRMRLIEAQARIRELEEREKREGTSLESQKTTPKVGAK